MPSTAHPPLEDALAEQRAAAQQQMPADTMATLQAATEDLEARGLTEQAVQGGETAPDFVLPNAVGEDVRLSDRLATGPVVLSFYRGGWCPYCNLELQALQAALPEIKQAGGQLLAVSPQTPDASLSTKEKGNLDFEVLSDAGNEVASGYGLVFTLPEAVQEAYDNFGVDLAAANADDSSRLPMPATYVIDADRVVRYAFVKADYAQRASPAKVVETLHSL